MVWTACYQTLLQMQSLSLGGISQRIENPARKVGELHVTRKFIVVCRARYRQYGRRVLKPESLEIGVGEH